MKHKIVTAVLVFGVIGGTASGFIHMRHHHPDRRAHFEAHIAEVCVTAAEKVIGNQNER